MSDSTCAQAVMVRLYPGTDIAVSMNLEAAKHLLRLVERYNWTRSVESRMADRWRKFWPVISRVERSIVAMFVRSNCGGEMAQHFDLSGLPSSLEPYRGDRRIVPISADVRKEFCGLLHIFHAALVDLEELQFAWAECEQGAFANKVPCLMPHVAQWLREEASGDDRLRAMLTAELMTGGMDEDAADQTALRLISELWCYLRDREDALYGKSRPSATRRALQ